MNIYLGSARFQASTAQ